MPRPKKPHLKQRADGRYCCTKNGKQFMGLTEDEALEKRKEYVRQLEQEQYMQQEGYTVAAYADLWLPLHKRGISPKCYNDYKKQLDVLCAVLGDKQMSAVTVDDAASVWTHYAGYSASTIKRARMLYIAMWETAIENEYCHRNPFKGKYAQPPKAPSGSHRCLTQEEQQLILSTPHRMQLAALIMLFAGLRRGEVMALTKDDITETEITVNKAVRFDGNKPVIVAPKTAAGVRRVPVIDNLRPALKNAPQRIISTKDGSLMTDTAWQRAWDSYISALEVALNGCQRRWYGKRKQDKGKTLPPYKTVDIRPHDLRHTYCTNLMNAGINMKQAMQWMGHSDEKMILHIYDHVQASRTQASVKALEKSLKSMQIHMQPPKQNRKKRSSKSKSAS